MERFDREFFNCSCHTEGVILEEFDAGEEKEICLALWSYGESGGVLSFSERLRWCWNILKRGLPWADAVILHSIEAKRLAESILRRIQ